MASAGSDRGRSGGDSAVGGGGSRGDIAAGGGSRLENDIDNLCVATLKCCLILVHTNYTYVFYITCVN